MAGVVIFQRQSSDRCIENASAILTETEQVSRSQMQIYAEISSGLSLTQVTTSKGTPRFWYSASSFASSHVRRTSKVFMNRLSETNIEGGVLLNFLLFNSGDAGIGAV